MGRSAPSKAYGWLEGTLWCRWFKGYVRRANMGLSNIIKLEMPTENKFENGSGGA
jgi:hypothetical protein